MGLSSGISFGILSLGLGRRLRLGLGLLLGLRLGLGLRLRLMLRNTLRLRLILGSRLGLDWADHGLIKSSSWA